MDALGKMLRNLESSPPNVPNRPDRAYSPGPQVERRGHPKKHSDTGSSMVRVGALSEARIDQSVRSHRQHLHGDAATLIGQGGRRGVWNGGVSALGECGGGEV